jgi:hypothetical protein
MSLVNDLETEIAFAFLVEKSCSEKVSSKDVLPLIGRLNEALSEISTESEAVEQVLQENSVVKSAAH